MLITNNDDMHDPAQNTSPTSPSLQQRKKRRSAAERRASHRRRSSQNEIQLAQLHNGLQQQRKKNSEENRENAAGQRREYSTSFSPIPDQSEPPEPTIPAPGEEDDNENVLYQSNGRIVSGLDGNWMNFIGEPILKESLSPQVELNNSHFTPMHQRSVSDHMVHSAQSIRRRQRELISPDQKPPFSPGPESSLKEGQKWNEIGEKREVISTRKFQREKTIDISNATSSQFLDGRAITTERSHNISPSNSSTLAGANIAKGPNRPSFEHSMNQASSTSGFIQLVGRFSAGRQNSDNNNRTIQHGKEPGRRSFKWKSLWERKAGVIEDIGKTNGQRKLLGQLGPLPEYMEMELGQRKRHSAVLAEIMETTQPQLDPQMIVRMRSTSSTVEEEGKIIPRPFSIIGTQDELAKYRVQDEEWTRLQRFVQDKAASKENTPVGEWDDSLDDDVNRPSPPPRMARPARCNPSSPLPCQTLGRTHKQKLQRTVSNRADFALTLPRKKGMQKVTAQQRRRAAQLTQPSRRKSIIHAMEPAKIAAIIAKEQQSEQTRLKTKRANMSRSSLKQLLSGGERNRAKVAPKIGNTSRENINEIDGADRIEKEKKRETKTNSMILGTIWSIRQRRKAKDASPRSLTNLWVGQMEKEEGNSGNGDFLLQRVPTSTDSKSTITHPLSPTPLSPLHTVTLPLNNAIDDCSASSSTHFVRPQLVQPQWEDLDLWSVQASSWTAKYAKESASLREMDRKRQNVIYELVLTERHHCQVLILLQQLYQEGLIRGRLVPPEQLKMLIPDVLDSLLDFHLSLLRRLDQRCSQYSIVDGIADILLNEFESGQYRAAAIQAYTTFCLGREDSIRHFGVLITQNQQFRKFMEFHENENNKDRSFKDCLLLIAQRLTKYPVLVEQIAKLECQLEQRELTQRAHKAVRQFAMEVDQELFQHEIQRKWHGLKKALDKSSAAKIIHPKEGNEFTVDDLVWPLENRSRKLLFVTKVFWRETMNGPDLELRLLLCDDIILFLRSKGSTNGTKLPPLQLFRHSEHAGVFPLQSILIRGQNPRRKSLLLIQTAKQRPDLYELAFSTNTELENCAQAIRKAKESAPNFIRLAEAKMLALDDGPIHEGELGIRKAEAEFQANMEQWRKGLDKLFEQRTSGEAELEKYFEGRMEFMDKLRSQLEQIPRRRGTKNGDDAEEGKQLKEYLKGRFADLQMIRVISLSGLAERAQRVKDADLLALFDDLHDLGVGKNGQMADSSSDEPRKTDDSSEERRIRPRRVSTYHGSADQRKSGSSSSSMGSSGIRRHTTVPGNKSSATLGAVSSDEEEHEREEKARLPLRMVPNQRRAVAKLIRENVKMRCELNRLKAKAALQEIHLVALSTKRAIGSRIKGETEEEGSELVVDRLPPDQEQMTIELGRREADLERREAELKAREEELVANSASLSPSTMHQNDVVQEQSLGQPIRSGPNSVRISNTYCGAGPVPNSSRSVENSPAQLGTERRAISQTELPRHLVVKTETKQRRK